MDFRLNRRFSMRQKIATEGETNPLVVRFVDDRDVKHVIFKQKTSSANVIQNSDDIQVNLEKENLSENEETPPRKRGRKKKKVEESFGSLGKSDDIQTIENDVDSDESFGKHSESPAVTGLFDDDDITGGEMCSFKTSKKREGMFQKAIESARKREVKSRQVQKNTPSKRNTPVQATIRSTQSSKTPLRMSLSKKKSHKKDQATLQRAVAEMSNAVIPKTPYSLRTRNKKAIQARIRIEEKCNTGESDSDYQDVSTGSEDSSESEDGNSDSSSDVGKSACRRSLKFQLPTSRRRGKDNNYVVQADEYFESRAGKCVTSDRDLSQLSTPRLDSGAMRALLTKCQVSNAHQKVLSNRRAGDFAVFQRWMFALNQGFSILVYGLGSKYKILQSFQKTMLSDSHVLVVNGFFPSLNIKDVLECLGRDVLGMTSSLTSPLDVIDWIESRRNLPRVFLLVHSLDGALLRCEKAQEALARLACLPRVHLIASVDHINCPLLWDQKKLSSLNFMWEDMTSFLPYQEETSYENSMLVKTSGTLALSSLLNVYRSLTHNSRGVFRIILDKHLEDDHQKFTGMAFSELYGRCREEMLVTSDLALRTMLTEFTDHEMVKFRRDGETLYIPTEPSLLKKFLQLIQDG